MESEQSQKVILFLLKEETKNENYEETREDVDIKRIAKNRIAYLQSDIMTD